MSSVLVKDTRLIGSKPTYRASPLAQRGTARFAKPHPVVRRDNCQSRLKPIGASPVPVSPTASGYGIPVDKFLSGDRCTRSAPLSPPKESLDCQLISGSSRASADARSKRSCELSLAETPKVRGMPMDCPTAQVQSSQLITFSLDKTHVWDIWTGAYCGTLRVSPQQTACFTTLGSLNAKLPHRRGRTGRSQGTLRSEEQPPTRVAHPTAYLEDKRRSTGPCADTVPPVANFSKLVTRFLPRAAATIQNTLDGSTRRKTGTGVLSEDRAPCTLLKPAKAY